MTLLDAWCIAVPGVILALAALVVMLNLYDAFSDNYYDRHFGTEIGLFFVCMGIPIAIMVAAIAIPCQLYQDTQHTGQVCVKSQSYTTYIKGIAYTGTECVVWGKPPATRQTRELS